MLFKKQMKIKNNFNKQLPYHTHNNNKYKKNKSKNRNYKIYYGKEI